MTPVEVVRDVLRRMRFAFGAVLCRLGLHKMVPYGYDRHGLTGGDCDRCGLGPL